MKLIIISGRSGSGKSVALRAAEDLGYYCVDNLPLTLLHELLRTLAGHHSRVAVCIDARSGAPSGSDIQRIRSLLENEGWTSDILYVDADNATLLKRFSETRRRHPLTQQGLSLTEAVDRERQLLEPLAMAADLILDTTRLSSKEFAGRIHDLLSSESEAGLDLVFESFGFKHGIPQDANYVFDARCIPNPYWKEALRPLTGLDEPVKAFLEAEPTVAEFMWQVKIFLHTWLPRFEEEHRSYLTVAIGCTGGQHRSVYLAEMLANQFRETARRVSVRHRDLELAHDDKG
jgi:UPF0042 nucleotide-binding protein